MNRIEEKCPQCNSRKLGFAREYRIRNNHQEGASECNNCSSVFYASDVSQCYHLLKIVEQLQMSIDAINNAKLLMEQGTSNRRVLTIAKQLIYVVKNELHHKAGGVSDE